MDNNPAPQEAAAPSPEIHINPEALEIARQLQIEISKALLANSLASTRGSMQLLQALTGALLTSYTTLIIGFGQQIGINRLPVIVIVLPVLSYTLSLVIGFLSMAFQRGANLVLGDLASGVRAYEAVIQAHRQQLALPLIFTIAGLAATTSEALFLYLTK